MTSKLLLTDEEKLHISLISKYPLDEVRDVIEETEVWVKSMIKEWGEEWCREAGHHYPVPNVKRKDCDICRKEAFK